MRAKPFLKLTAVCALCTLAVAGCAVRAPQPSGSPTVADIYRISEVRIEFAPGFDSSLWPASSGESEEDVRARIRSELAQLIDEAAQSGKQGKRAAEAVVQLGSADVVVDAGGNVGSIRSSLMGEVELVWTETGEAVAGFPVLVERIEHHMSGTFSLPLSGRLTASTLNVQLDWLLKAFAARMLLRMRGEG